MSNEFRIELFGKCLKKRRKEVKYKGKPLTQSVLAKLVGVDIKTVQNWEKGKNKSPDSMNVSNVIQLCRHLDCDFEYLFGAIDTPRKDVADVQEAIGLSPIAIEVLSHIKNTPIRETILSFSKILEHEKFHDLLKAIHLHIHEFNRGRFKVYEEHIDHIADSLNCKQDEVEKYLEANSKTTIESTLMDIVKSIDLGYNKKRTAKRSSKDKRLF